MERIQNIPKDLISSTLNIDYKTPMSKVHTYLKKYAAVIVNNDRAYYGIVDTRTVYRAQKGLKLPVGMFWILSIESQLTINQKLYITALALNDGRRKP